MTFNFIFGEILLPEKLLSWYLLNRLRKKGRHLPLSKLELLNIYKLFSIIIPLYNKRPYICRAIDSVLNQVFNEFEIIVINDGSTDGGDKIIEEKYFSKITLIHQQNQGVSQARNKGIENSTFGYMAFLDADDFWHPHYLSHLQKVILKKPNVGIIATGFSSFDAENEGFIGSVSDMNPLVLREVLTLSTGDYFKQAIYNNLIWTSAMTIKKSFFELHPGFDPKLKFGEDIDVWYRALFFYGEITVVPNILAYYSKEDEGAASRQVYLFEDTLMSKISDPHYFPSDQRGEVEAVREFEAFKAKWIYLRLHPLYKEKRNKKAIQELISNLPVRYPLIGIFYLIPFKIIHWFFSKHLPYKFFLKYLNFCFKHIYHN